ncbi:hypothetical protein WP3S18E02_07400 [Aeromonas caviae]|nr:hypothetical protein WP3S18E02_07400 [Aeromonas caviae]
MFIAAKYVAYSVPKRHAANHFKVRIVCFDHFPLSTLRATNSHVCRGSLLISPDFTETSHNLIFPS